MSSLVDVYERLHTFAYDTQYSFQFFFSFFLVYFFIFIIRDKQKFWHTPKKKVYVRSRVWERERVCVKLLFLSLSLSLSLSLYRIHICTYYTETPLTPTKPTTPLSLGSTHTLNLSPDTCKTGFLSLDGRLSLSLSHTHTHTMYTLCIYLFITYGFQSYSESFHVWEWYKYWRMSMAQMGRMVRTMIWCTCGCLSPKF